MTKRRRNESADWPILLVITVWLATFYFGYLRYRPPAPKPDTAPISQFSAGRAEEIFRKLFGDDTPHPAGSEENAQLRKKIANLLESYGYQVEFHKTQAVAKNRRYPSVDPVELTNMLAVLKGTSNKPAIMLTAHFDSVPEAPGASDDGVGTTVVLEIARMLADEPPPERDIVFLLTDGEEFGLLGADRFTDEHPIAKEIAAVVNLEARGSTGPSLMFETSENSLWLVRIFSRLAERPVTSSLFYEIYKQLPNDTDFSEYKDFGIEGYNFAFIGNVKHYHTPDDNFENADRGSLQHHGDQALALIRELCKTDIESQPTGRAVYFDFLCRFVIYWPAEFSIWMAIAASLFSLLAGLKTARHAARHDHQSELQINTDLPGASRDGPKPIRPWFGLLAFMVGLGLLIGIGALVRLGLAIDGVFDNPFPRFALPIGLTFWLVGLVVLLIYSFLLSGRLHWLSVWLGGWLVWSALSVVSAIILTGGCYLFVIPALFAGVSGIVMNLTNRGSIRSIASLVPLVIVGLIWLPLERLFYDGVGFSMNGLLIGRVAIVLSCLFGPLMLASNKCRQRLLYIASALAVLSVLLSVVLN